MNSPNSTTVDVVQPQSRLAYDIHELVRDGIDLDATHGFQDEPLWQRLCDLGSELWLDSSDSKAIETLWSRQFRGLTIDRVSLNQSVRNGNYDDLIERCDQLLRDLSPEQRVRETGLILHARHALRLIERYQAQVSVALPADLANQHEASVMAARRLYGICPEHFVVKLPFTPAGILVTRTLRAEGIPVNLGLGFSARQNYLATVLANPSYVNIAVGRLNAYVADNGLGDGRWVGQQATLSSQDEVSAFARGLPQCETRQIATSIHTAEQLASLAGVDVLNIPPDVAIEAARQQDRSWTVQLQTRHDVILAADVDAAAIRIDTLWSVPSETRKFVEQMILHRPASEAELMEGARDHGVSDLFPQFSEEDRQALSQQGKVPRHQAWGDKIMQGHLAIDSLLTLAGLEELATAQAELDQQIRHRVAPDQ